MTVGMTLGKFAPLHRGHQSVIELALAQTDHVIVVIYNAVEVTSVPIEVRGGWIKKLYPSVEVIFAHDGPTTVSDDPAITAQHDAYLQRLLAGRGVTHFYSSEFYGDHVSRALGAIDCRVDVNREIVPISGTAIRSNLFQLRRYIDPIVYRDLVTKVVFLGAPCTGKTTLAQHMAAEYKTVWMPEYGREYWDAHQSERRLTQEQLVEIAEGHRQREDAMILDVNQYFFIDTDATITYQFSRYYHAAVLPKLEQLAAECRSRYDIFCLCDTDIPYDDTWDRSGEVHRADFQANLEADLKSRGTPLIRLRGSLSERAATVKQVLLRSKS